MDIETGSQTDTASPTSSTTTTSTTNSRVAVKTTILLILCVIIVYFLVTAYFLTSKESITTNAAFWMLFVFCLILSCLRTIYHSCTNLRLLNNTLSTTSIANRARQFNFLNPRGLQNNVLLISFSF